ncbi:hypothetical protein [Shewanella sp.]|jgi:hypothetical protein|uniref:hypothetical protein n=1 Tax=Shewanella sp. TaxID=50422 RepID=UPI003D1530CF
MPRITPELITAIAGLISSVLWPAVTIWLVHNFKVEISGLVKRVKKGKVLGQEFELSEQLNELTIKADKVRSEALINKTVTDAPANSDDISQKTRYESDIEKIISISSENEELGIILLSQKIESELKILMASGGYLAGKDNLSFSDMLAYLQRNAAVSENLVASIKIFWDVRNKVIHRGHGKVERDNLIRIVDIGLTVLTAIRSIPHEINIVKYINVDIFNDAECKQIIEGVKAVILETHSPGRAQVNYRIFPTTKTHFSVGMQVSWEWGRTKQWGQAYYKDPADGLTKSAWSSSMEFTGRDLEKI